MTIIFPTGKVFIISATAVAMALTAFAQGPDEKKIKYNVDHLDKTWGIKFKSASAKSSTSGSVSVMEIKITLEFTKDVPDLKEMRKAFTPVFDKVKMTSASPVCFLLFDEENVAVEKAHIQLIEGELTGKSGDAFRALIRSQRGLFDKVVKIDARPNEADGEK